MSKILGRSITYKRSRTSSSQEIVQEARPFSRLLKERIVAVRDRNARRTSKSAASLPLRLMMVSLSLLKQHRASRWGPKKAAKAVVGRFDLVAVLCGKVIAVRVLRHILVDPRHFRGPRDIGPQEELVCPAPSRKLGPFLPV